MTRPSFTGCSNCCDASFRIVAYFSKIFCSWGWEPGADGWIHFWNSSLLAQMSWIWITWIMWNFFLLLLFLFAPECSWKNNTIMAIYSLCDFLFYSFRLLSRKHPSPSYVIWYWGRKGQRKEILLVFCDNAVGSTCS